MIFGTFANINYLPQLLSMIESFHRHTIVSRLAVVALDSDTASIIRELHFPRLDIYYIGELESDFPLLLEAKSNRTTSEYFFTLTSAIPKFLLKNYTDSKYVIYIDADLFFYDNPESSLVILKEGDSVLLTPHNFAKKNLELKVYGEFNTGFIAFRNSQEGSKIASWWLESCIDWCKDTVEDGKYADQKYLEYFSVIAPGVRVSRDFGLNMGPWGLNNLKSISVANGRIQVNEQRLYAFHFSGLSWNTKIIILGAWRYRHRLANSTFHLIFLPYLLTIRKWESYLRWQKTGVFLPSGMKSLRSTRKVSFSVGFRALVAGDLKTWRSFIDDTY